MISGESINTADEMADEISALLERAATVGIAEDVMRQIAQAGELTSEIQADTNRKILAYAGRGRTTNDPAPSELTTTRAACEAIARQIGLRSISPTLPESHLVVESLFSAVLSFREKQEAVRQRPKGRGKPSALTTPEAGSFIRELAEIWLAYTGRTARSGRGDDTANFNFNELVHNAFSCAGISTNKYTLSSAIKNALEM